MANTTDKPIQMLVSITGGRWDGTDWPPANGLLWAPGWEADDLIAAGHARPWPEGVEPPFAPPLQPDPEPVVPEPAPEETGPPGTGIAAEAGIAEDPTEAPEVSSVTGVSPKPADPKSSWVGYAVAQGISTAEAEAMTKQQLMQNYGGRL